MERSTGFAKTKAAWILILLSLVAALSFVPGAAWADAAAQVGDAQYETLQEAIDAAEDGDEVVLLQDLTLTSQIAISDAELTIDLGGFMLTFDLAEDDASADSYYEDAIVVSGESEVVIQNGGISDERSYGNALSGMNTFHVLGASSLCLEGVDIQVCMPNDAATPNVIIYLDAASEADADGEAEASEETEEGEEAESSDEVALAPAVTLGSETRLYDTANTDGPEVDADAEEEQNPELAEYSSTAGAVGVLIAGAYTDETIADMAEGYAGATLTVEAGAVITVWNNAIQGEYSSHGTTINIEEGAYVASGDADGIFQPQYGTINVTGGTIQGEDAGIEIRAGILNVSGDDAVVEALNTDGLFAEASEDGATMAGAGIAVSQSAANLSLEVNISGGIISGYYALYEQDLQDEVTDGISLDVAEGMFIAVRAEIDGATEDVSTVPAVYSADCTAFVSNGYFSSDPDDSYVAEGSLHETNESEAAPYTIAQEAKEVDYEGVYDGEAHAACVEFASSIETCSVVYSTDGSTYSEEAPTFTDAGSYTVYYQAAYTVDGVEKTAEGELSVVISQATLTAAYAGETIAFGATPALTVEVSGFVGEETAETAAGYVAPTVDASDCSAEGSYELSPQGGSATNYAFEYESGTLVVTHSLVYVEEVAASCTEDGTAAHYACLGCSLLFSDAEGTAEVAAEDLVLAASGEHSYDEGVVTAEATCTEAGSITYTCLVCGATTTEEIAALGHDYLAEWSWAEDYSSAYLTLTCANDSTHVTVLEVAPTSEVITEATETEDGVIVYTAQASYDGQGYTSTLTAGVTATGELSTLSEETAVEAEATETEEEESAEEESAVDETAATEASDAEGEEAAEEDSEEESEEAEEEADEALTGAGDSTGTVVAVVIVVALIALVVIVIALVLRHRKK